MLKFVAHPQMHILRLPCAIKLNPYVFYAFAELQIRCEITRIVLSTPEMNLWKSNSKMLTAKCVYARYAFPYALCIRN